MTSRNEENFEITSEARDYNNEDIDETKSEINLDEDPDSKSRDAYHDPYTKVDGGMASTESFTLWKTLMPVFSELARLDYFKQEIASGNKTYKDFYVSFKKNLLSQFDDAVGGYKRTNQLGTDREASSGSIDLKFWRQLPWDIRVKTYLTLYAIEIEAQQNDELTEKEVNILRWAALLLHIGCAKPSKTSKVYVYSFLSALFILQMLESGDIKQELLEGAAYEEMQLQQTH